jgi:hypothetical protein
MTAESELHTSSVNDLCKAVSKVLRKDKVETYVVRQVELLVCRLRGKQLL